MNDTHFAINWATQAKRFDKTINPPIEAFKTYQATVKNIRFTYPKSWWEGINLWDEIDNVPVNYELGYVSPIDWETITGAPVGLWFFIGNVPPPTTCMAAAELVDIVSATPVNIKGLNQTVYYCETIARPAYDKNKFIANGGLLSVRPSTSSTRFSIKDYLTCHPITDDWFVYNPSDPKNSLFQFSCRTFGIIPSEASKTFSTKADALAFFSTAYYKQGKQVMLSTVVV